MLNRRHLYRYLHDLLNYFFDDLRHLDDPLYDSRNDDYLLYDPLNLHTFRHLHDLLDDLLLDGWHLFDLLEVYLLGNDLLLADQHWHLLTHDEWHVLDDLHWLLFGEDDVLDDLDRDVFLQLYRLDEWHLVDLCFYSDLWNCDGHLDVFLYFSDLHPSLIDDPWNLHLDDLQLLHHPQHLSYHLYLLWRQFYYPLDRYNLLNDLLLHLNPFLIVMHRHDLLYDFSDDLDPSLNVWHDLRDLLVSDHLDDLLDDLRDDDDLLSFYYLLDDLLDDHLHRLQHFFLGLDVADYFFDHLDYLDLLLHYDFLDLDHHWLLDLHDLLDDHLLGL